jgi:methyl-accepting chemotaxis protein
MSLNDLKLGTRLNCGFAAVLTLMLAIAGIGYLRLVQTQASIDSTQDMGERVQVATEWVGNSRLNAARLIAIVKSGSNPEVVAHFEPQMKGMTEQIGMLQKKLEASITTDEERALIAAVAEKRKTFIATREEVFAALKGGNSAAVPELLDSKLLPASESYLASIAAFQKHEEKMSEVVSKAIAQDVKHAQLTLALLSSIGLFLGLYTAWFMTRSVTGPLKRAVAATRTIAQGDLSQSIDANGKDELSDLLRALSEMQGGLRKLVGQVRQSTDSISTASTEIAIGNQDLSLRTEQTASNLQQTASSMEELTGTVKQSADSARQANQLASSAAEVAARGGHVVSQVVSTMDEINASSKKISDIIGVIDGIAFQTNILALNAAVEAARAGEQGRGFAVVAAEVRSLAGRSAEAAKEIKSLIGASVERVEAGSRLVNDAGRTMTEIVGSVQRVSDIIGEITAASAEQSDGIGQVNKSVTQLDQMTQQNAALVEESAAAAESLKGQAQQLAAMVDTFRLGSEAAPKSSAAPKAAAASKAAAAKPASRPHTTPVNKPAAPAATSMTPSRPAATQAVAAPAHNDEWETF